MRIDKTEAKHLRFALPIALIEPETVERVGARAVRTHRSTHLLRCYSEAGK